MDGSIIIGDKSEGKQPETGADHILFIVGFIFLFLAGILVLLLGPPPQSTAVSPEISLLQPTDDPVQLSIQGTLTNPILRQDDQFTWTLTPRAGFQIAGRVLGNKKYSDWESSVVPRDLALGWGEMSSPAADKWIRWRQSGRWYHYSWSSESPYDGRYIRDHSANVHIIPATANLDKALREIQKNDHILLEGRLVDLQASSTDQVWQVNTSLDRQDSGSGACEILYVERLIWNGREYK